MHVSYVDPILCINIVRIILIILFVIVGVAYLTILEQKILRYLQLRKDPNKIGFIVEML